MSETFWNMETVEPSTIPEQRSAPAGYVSILQDFLAADTQAVKLDVPTDRKVGTVVLGLRQAAVRHDLAVKAMVRQGNIYLIRN